jgi:hypothetical protein
MDGAAAQLLDIAAFPPEFGPEAGQAVELLVPSRSAPSRPLRGVGGGAAAADSVPPLATVPASGAAVAPRRPQDRRSRALALRESRGRPTK